MIIDMKSDTCCDLRTETFSLEVRGLLFIDIVEVTTCVGGRGLSKREIFLCLYRLIISVKNRKLVKT